MARARNIKPSFFQNEDIVELSCEARLLFIGLWTLADREGRLENRPKKIKMSLFPADEINVSELLSNIHKLGFIKLYNINETDVIQITNFSKHQSPHGLEKDSELPDENGIYTVYNRNPKNKTTVGKPIYLQQDQVEDFYNKTGQFAGNSTDLKGENGFAPSNTSAENNTNISQEQVKNSYNTVSNLDRNALNPDSLNPESFNLNPDFENPHTNTHEQKSSAENQNENSNTENSDSENSLDEILNLWNPNLHEVNSWLQQSGERAMTQEMFDSIKPEFLSYYADRLKSGVLKERALFGKFVSWVKNATYKNRDFYESRSKPTPDHRNVNTAWQQPQEPVNYNRAELPVVSEAEAEDYI